MPLQRRDLALLFIDFFRIIDLFCLKFQLFIGALVQYPVKTGLVTDMTLAGIDGYFENQAVLVAINEYLFHFLEMAAFLALLPQFLPGSTEICGIAGLNRQIKGLAIHIGYHQDLACLCVLSYRRYQAVVIEFRKEFDPFFDILL